MDWDGIPDSFDRNWLESYFGTISEFQREWDSPVAVNEYGIVRWVPGGDKFLDDQLGLFEELGLNHAIWMWAPAWEPWTEEVNAMNFRFGQDPRNQTDQIQNPILDILQKYWVRNTLRPSNFILENNKNN